MTFDWREQDNKLAYLIKESFEFYNIILSYEDVNFFLHVYIEYWGCGFISRRVKYKTRNKALPLSTHNLGIYCLCKLLFNSTLRDYVALLLHCPRLVEGWRLQISLTTLHSVYMCLSQVRSLYFSGCRLLLYIIFVFRFYILYNNLAVSFLVWIVLHCHIGVFSCWLWCIYIPSFEILIAPRAAAVYSYKLTRRGGGRRYLHLKNM